MKRLPESENVCTRNGTWGEDVATAFLRRDGFEIVDRNARPCASDRRYEIDIVAWDRKSDTMVFVEVKQHTRLSPWQRRIRSVDRRKQMLLRKACNAWRRTNRWQGGFRFDIIEVYGVPGGGKPVIDHITHVNLFAKPERFVNWGD